MILRSFLLTVILLAAPPSFGELMTMKVVSEGSKMKPIAGWPEGTMSVINHKFRTGGWHSEFSECQNDRYYFGLEVESPTDLHRLIKTFAKIRSDKLVISIATEDGGSHVDDAAVVFTLGNQPIIDAWFKRLPVIGLAGERKFGVHTYTRPPEAQAPTLFLYAGHKAIDLRVLRIPKHVTVEAPIHPGQREKDPTLADKVDKLVARQGKKQ